jgi:FKBP-type peptidyl-prolyl cis-trans isomerase
MSCCAVRNVYGLFTFLIFVACNSEVQQQKSNSSPAELKEQLIRANKIFVKNQLDDIQSYIEKHGYKTDSTLTGLRFQIKRGNLNHAAAATENDIACIRYKLKLLDGRECYTADSALYREYHLSKDDMPKGLREGILLMHEGDKALLLIPSYLAFGLTGDGDCIPPNAALVMTVTLEKVIKSEK